MRAAAAHRYLFNGRSASSAGLSLAGVYLQSLLMGAFFALTVPIIPEGSSPIRDTGGNHLIDSPMKPQDLLRLYDSIIEILKEVRYFEMVDL